MTNLHQLTSQCTISYPITRRSYCNHRLLWHHFNLYNTSVQSNLAKGHVACTHAAVYRSSPEPQRRL